MRDAITGIKGLARNFLSGKAYREFLVFLFFLVVSGTFWIVMALNETYEQEVVVPVRLTNVPRNVVVTQTDADTLRVTLRDKGYVLMVYMTTQKLRPIVSTFASTTATKSDNRGQISSAEILRQLYAQLYGTTKVVSVKPERIGFTYNFGESRRLPVKLAGSVVPGHTHYLARTRFWPETVTVYASRHTLDSIKAIYTERINIVDFEDTLITSVRLRSIPGVKIVPDRVRMALYPDILTEESVEVPIEAINMPEGKVLRTFPSKVRVRFIVGASMFRSIRASDFRIIANYKELAANPSDKCNVYLVTAPNGISKPQLELKQVDYLIEQQ